MNGNDKYQNVNKGTVTSQPSLSAMDEILGTDDVRSIFDTLSPSQIEELVYLCKLREQDSASVMASPLKTELHKKSSPVTSSGFATSSMDSIDVELPFPDFLHGYPTSDSGGEFDHYSTSGSERDARCFDLQSLIMSNDPCLNMKLESHADVSSLGCDFNPSLFDAGLASFCDDSAGLCTSGSMNFNSPGGVANDLGMISIIDPCSGLEEKPALSTTSNIGINVADAPDLESMNFNGSDLKQVKMLLKLVLDRSRSGVADNDCADMADMSPNETIVCAAPSLPNASQLKSLLVSGGRKFAYGINMAVNKIPMHKIPLKPKKLKSKKGSNSLPENSVSVISSSATDAPAYYPSLMTKAETDSPPAKNPFKSCPKSVLNFLGQYGVPKVVRDQAPAAQSLASTMPIPPALAPLVTDSQVQAKIVPQMAAPLLLPVPDSATAQHSRIGAPKAAPQSAQCLAPSKPLQPLKPSKEAPREMTDETKPRKKRISNHNVIEKRYRNNITNSLDELKDLMLGTGHKTTKNNILRHAIGLIKELSRKNSILEEENNHIRKFFEKLKCTGVISKDIELPVSRVFTPAASGESAVFSGDESMSPGDSDMYDNDDSVSPQSPMFMDRTRILTCLLVFMCLFVSPFALLGGQPNVVHTNGHQSRVLLSVPTTSDSTYSMWITSSLIQVLVTMLIIMWMLFKGKPRCLPESKRACRFWSRMSLAKASMNRGAFTNARVDVHLAMINLGHKSGLSCFDMLLSVIWNSICHVLYQLGILPLLRSVASSVLPTSVSLHNGRASEQFAAKMLTYGYESLHEITLRDRSCSFLESSYCILNAINNAENSGSHELLCKIYVVCAIHMKERLPPLLSHLLLCYFTNCAHHVAESNGRDVPLSVEWIFERFGYEFFTGGLWNLDPTTAFSSCSFGDITQIVYEQYQSYLLLKCLKRIVVPDAFYPSEDPKERRDRTLNLLKQLAAEADREMRDDISSRQQAFYGWWSSLLRQYITVKQTGEVNMQELDREKDFFEDFACEESVHYSLTVMKEAFDTLMLVKLLSDDRHTVGRTTDDQSEKHLIAATREQVIDASKRLAILSSEAVSADHEEICELIKILVCEMLIEASIALWELRGAEDDVPEKSLLYFQANVAILKSFAAKYNELNHKIERYLMTGQVMSCSNPVSMSILLKRKRKNFTWKGTSLSYQEAEQNAECVFVGQKHLAVLERLWNADRFRQIQCRLSGRRS